MRIGLRGSPSWPGEALRPDTLKQTEQSQTKITLADGAGHTFMLCAGEGGQHGWLEPIRRICGSV